MNSTLDRRHFLRSAGMVLALPSLEAFSAPTAATVGPRNFVAVGTLLGWHQKAFYPKQSGMAYDMPPTLTPLKAFRDDMTVFSGLDHRSVNNHAGWPNFLCGAPLKTYSLDQMIADQIGQKSRFPSIELSTGRESVGNSHISMSFTRRGVGLSRIQRPRVLYNTLFVSNEDRARTEHILQSGRSSLDGLLADAKRLQRALPYDDRNKLEEYFDSMRAVEKRMGRQLETINDPIPRPDYQLPGSIPLEPSLQIELSAILYDLMALALETNSSRVLSLFVDGGGQVFSFDGKALGTGYHKLSHHGNDPKMIADLVAIETAHMHSFSGFIKQLKEKKNAHGKSLLDDTVVLLGTGMGDASRHSNQNLPTLVAGGGFKHQGHVAIDRSKKGSPLLGDLYITLMQKLGMEVDQFKNATSNMNEVFS
jgi:hypothetical protein